MSNPSKHDGAWPASHECYKCGYKALNDEVEPVRVDRELLWACVGKCNRELLSREEVDLTEQGDDIEPLVCSVCGSTEAGAGEMNAGVFTCLECFKKKNEEPVKEGKTVVDTTVKLFFTEPDGEKTCIHFDTLEVNTRMDALESMMAMQYGFNNKLGHTPWVNKPKATAKWLQKWLLCISQEVAECVDFLAWKHWSKRSGNKLVAEADLYKEAHMKEIKLELIDIQHFLLSAFLELRMDADEVYALYCEKMQVNHDRQEGDY